MRFALLLLLFLLPGCSVFMAKPEVTLKNVKLVGLSSRDMELDFYFSVKNPNSIDLRLEDYSYDVNILSLPLAKGNATTSYVFYSNSSTDFLIPVKIPYDNLMEILKRDPNPDAIPYQIHAELSIGPGIGGMTVPLNKSGTFAIPGEIYPSWIKKKIGDFLKGLER
jgi:LEA14-like dessication related protein